MYIVSEEQRTVATKENGDLRTNLREVDRARLEARRELQELRRQHKILEMERAKLAKDVEDLLQRVAHHEEREENVCFSLCLKQMY